jgi:hypothetical protein
MRTTVTATKPNGIHHSSTIGVGGEAVNETAPVPVPASAREGMARKLSFADEVQQVRGSENARTRCVCVCVCVRFWDVIA